MKQILFLFFIVCSFHTKAVKKRVLFLGNSYTYVNDLPNTLKNISDSFGDSIIVDNYTVGGYTLNLLSNDANTMLKIKQGNWDYIIIQAQSQEPSFDPMQVATDTYPYAKKLCDSIKQYNNCGEIVFYMTWGRKNGDASNCAFYPPVCTYNGMQQRLRESYLEMCDSNEATCAPVGVAWKKVRDTNPLIELYQTDESHPSIHGTYLAACVFYSTIFHKYTTGSSFISTGITTLDAGVLQLIASNTVMDSIETWQQFGHLPKSSYLSTNIFNTYTFTNTTLRGNSYLWEFGDGTTSTMQHPTHTYNSSGNYFAKLISTSTTCKKDSTTHSLFVSVGVKDVEKRTEKISCINNVLILQQLKESCLCTITNMEGKIVFVKKILSKNDTIQLTDIPKGMYQYTVQYQQRNEKFGSKFMIQ